MPGGKVEVGENPWIAAAQETHEEAGVSGKCKKQNLVVEYIDKRMLRTDHNFLYLLMSYKYLKKNEYKEGLTRKRKWMEYEEAKNNIKGK